MNTGFGARYPSRSFKKRFARGLRLLDEKPRSGVSHRPVGGYGGLPLAFAQHSFVGLAAARSHKGALVQRPWIPLVFWKEARSFNSLKVCFPPFGSVRRHDCAKLFLVVPWKPCFMKALPCKASLWRGLLNFWAWLPEGSRRNDRAPQAAVHMPGMWGCLQEVTGGRAWCQSPAKAG